jgi:hypothetical protein
MMPENKPESSAEAVAGEKPQAEHSPSGEEALPNEQPDVAPAPRKKSRLGPWLFLLLVLIGLPTAWYFAPVPLRNQALHWLGYEVPPAQQNAPPEASQAITAPPASTDSGETITENAPGAASPTSEESGSTTATEAAPTSTAEPAQGAVTESEPEATATTIPPSEAPTASPAETQTSSKPAAESDNASSPASGTSVASLSPQQSANLLEQIKQLQTEVAAIQVGQAELRQQLQVRQQMELRNKLRWLSRPGSSLAQQAAMWSDIAALPDLGDAQRTMAETMAKLAQDDLLHVEAWRKRLTNLAEKLPEVQQADVLPKSQNTYLAWLTDAFHLHQAPAELDQQRAELGRQALAMAQSLASENWPQARDWRDLVMALQHQFGDDVNLGLPESLDVPQHIASMRENAAGWLEKL